MISRRQIISRSAGPIFNLYIEWKRFGCRWSIWTSLWYLKGRCHGNRFCAKKMANSPLSSFWHSETVWVTPCLCKIE